MYAPGSQMTEEFAERGAWHRVHPLDFRKPLCRAMVSMDCNRARDTVPDGEYLCLRCSERARFADALEKHLPDLTKDRT
jgi:hypothetical protein